MDRETARQEIKRNWRSLITGITGPARTRVNGEESYICPLCGHGTHGDGLTRNPQSKDGNGLKCFGCGFSGDIIDLYQQAENVDYNQAFSLLANELNLTVDEYRPTAADDFKPQNGPTDAKMRAQGDFNDQNGRNTRGQAETGTAAKLEATEGPADFTAYYMACRQYLADNPDGPGAAYIKGRGISLETALEYWTGFDPAADTANAPGALTDRGKKYPRARVIIPSTASHYTARAIDDNPKFAKMQPKGAHPGIFNSKALYAHEAQTVFVTESAWDALSLLEIGAPAIATNSADNAAALVKMLDEQRTAATLVLCLHNDGAGQRATKTIKEGLQRLNISFVCADIFGGHKDANEYLQADRAGFSAAVQAAQLQTAAKPDNVSYYIRSTMADEIEAFKADIKTGYENLDNLTGGLYSGLYVVAAISSLGKTTFVHQMADQIAAAGHDVLYFSLEQSRLEMVTKSIARTMAKKDMQTAVTSLSIRKGFLPNAVLTAAKEYQEATGDRLSIIEGNFSCDISFIGDYTRQYIARNKTRPVLIVDYLQILQPSQEEGRRQTTKEIVDLTVTELKRLSREQGITVVAICSVNRANYLTPIDFESLKESGAIEYGADVIWGLQLHCLTADPAFDKANNLKEQRQAVKDAKAETPRSIDLVCLKNRYGIANFSCSFNYFPANDLFVGVTDFEEPAPARAGRKIGG